MLPLGYLGATYDDQLRLIGKHLVDFLVLIELFPLGFTAEALRANIGSKSAFSRRRGGGRFIQNFGYKGSPPPTIFLRKKTRLNDLSYGIKIWTDCSSVFLSQSTRLTDGQTERRIEFSSLDRVCNSTAR